MTPSGPLPPPEPSNGDPDRIVPRGLVVPPPHGSPVRETIEEETRHVLAIAGRDLLEFLRDGRTVFITLLLPMLMYPIVAVSSAVGVRSAVSDQERQLEPVPVRLALSGNGAESLASRLRELEQSESVERDGWPSSLTVEVVPAAEATRRLERAAVDFWLDVPAGFLDALAGNGTAKLEARVGGWRPADQRTRDQFAAVIDSLADEATRERLERAGLPKTAIDPVRLGFRDAQGMPTRVGRQSVPSVIAAILILLSVLTLTGAFYPAVDAIAGEKERGTIETLLIAPCQAWEIAAGKFWAILVVTMVTLLSNVLSIAATAWVAIRFIPKELEIFPRQTVAGLAVAVAAFLALSVVGAALCLAVTAASRSTKEAQHSLTPVIVAVSLLSGFAIAPGVTPFGPLAAVPFAGQVLIAREALAGGGATGALLVPLAVTILSAAGCAVLLLWVTGALLADEEVLFRGPDAAEGPFKRPPARHRPTPVQGVLPVVAGLAALWYGQAFAPEELLLTIPLQQLASVALPLVAVLWWQRVDRPATLRLAAPATGAMRSLVALAGAAIIGVGLFVVAAIILTRFVGTDASEEARALSAKIAELVSKRPFWLVWIVIALVPAVCEELLFRGWLLSGLTGRHDDSARTVLAVVAQAMLFAVMHLLPERMPGTFLIGLATGWLALRTGSILPGIVCHAANNSMPILLLKAASVYPQAVIDPIWVTVAGAAALVVGWLIVAASTTTSVAESNRSDRSREAPSCTPRLRG